MQQLMCIIYDSMTNSVFEGQVLQPLLALKENNPEQRITIISFEPNVTAVNSIKTIPVIQLKKIPFMGRLSLFFAVRQLRSVLMRYTQYRIIARGPIAGYLSLQAYNSSHCSHLCIQARGLLAHEYRYTHQQSYRFMRLLHHLRAYLYKKLEYDVYSTQKPHVSIEAVSPALKKYLIAHYNAQESKITIAQRDIPTSYAPEQIKEWRGAKRTELAISSDTYVYCYNGSVKPWQCTEETIIFFKKELEKYPNIFLLVITQDQNAFIELAHKHKLHNSTYRIISVKHDHVCEYLSACDAGIILRETHLVNWVSRPTKVLEYQAVGLKIIHNNTVGILCDL